MKPAKLHRTTVEDAELRNSVVDVLIAEISDPCSQFYVNDGYAQWAKRHKRLLIGLFGGGQGGIQNQNRIIALIKRELEGSRRSPAEAVCGVLDLILAGQLADSYPELARHWTRSEDMLRSMLLSRSVTDLLMMPGEPDVDGLLDMLG